MRPFGGPGRGRKMTLAGMARECAKNVLRFNETTSPNRLYNMAYWGKAMRGHVASMKESGETMDAAVSKMVRRAEVILETFCDGQDCSFVRSGPDGVNAPVAQLDRAAVS